VPEPRRERIGRYEILGELGHGAMGVVYEARDPNLDRVVAVKALRVDPGLPSEQHAELERRFFREAIAAGRLSHPNIVAVYDVVEVDGVPYIVMECVDGRTLADLIASGDGSQHPMETTLTALVVRDRTAYLAHVGDRRAYLVRGRRMRQLTADHSRVGDLLKRGVVTEVEAESHPDAHVVLRALGIHPEIEVDRSFARGIESYSARMG